MAHREAAFIVRRDPAALRGDLEAYLPLLPGRIADAGPDRLTLHSGHRFALNPNRLWHVLRAEIHPHPDGSRLRVVLASSGYPWLEERAGRILDHRLAQLAAFLRERTGSIESENAEMEKSENPRSSRSEIRPDPEPFLQGDWSTAPAVAASGFRLLLSVVLAIGFAVGVMELFGLAAIDRTVDLLLARSLALQDLGEPAFPAPSVLTGLSWGFRAGAALFIALPFGYGVGLAVALLLLFQENRPRPAAVVGWGMLALSALLTPCLAEGAPLGTALGCALAAPLAAHAGYALGGARRPLVLWTERTESTPWPLIALGCAVLLAFLGGLQFQPGGNARKGDDALVAFRDRQLLNRAGGRAFTDFYYEHTLYPAEAVREPHRRLPVLALLLTRRPGLAERIRKGTTWRPSPDAVPEAVPVVVQTAETPEMFLSLARLDPSPWDLFVVDDAASSTGPPGDSAPILAALRSAAPRGGVGVILAKDGDRFAPLGPVMATAPPAAVGWEEAAGLAFAAQDVRSRFRFLKELSLSALFGTGGALLALAGALALFAAGAGALRALPPSRASATAVFAAAGLILIGLEPFLLRRPGEAEVRLLIPALESAVARNDDASVREALRAASSAEARFEAAFAIDRGGEGLPAESWAPILLPMLNDDDPRVRARAAGGLGKVAAGAGPDSPARSLALQALLDRTGDSHYMVRYRSAEALGRIGDPAARKTLDRMARTDTWYVAAYAYRALREIEDRSR